jgi:HEAT repeat protein
MNIQTVFSDKSIKAKAKVALVGEWLIDKSLTVEELLAFAAQQESASNKASCIEALEFATKIQPEIADQLVWDFVTAALSDAEPRVKWESAKVIGNVAKCFESQAQQPIQQLLVNAHHEGTVVRWASAWALGEILKLNTSLNTQLLPQVNALMENETDNGIQKKYADAVKKLKK